MGKHRSLTRDILNCGGRRGQSSALWDADGLGLLALARASREPARRTFRDTLRQELIDRGIRLVSAELGRLRWAPVWVVTSELADGRMLRVDVPAEGEPYESPQQLAEGVVRSMNGASAVR